MSPVSKVAIWNVLYGVSAVHSIESIEGSVAWRVNKTGVKQTQKGRQWRRTKGKWWKRRNDSRHTSGTVMRSNGSLNLPIQSKGQWCGADEDGQWGLCRSIWTKVKWHWRQLGKCQQCRRWQLDGAWGQHEGGEAMKGKKGWKERISDKRRTHLTGCYDVDRVSHKAIVNAWLMLVGSKAVKVRSRVEV